MNITTKTAGRIVAQTFRSAIFCKRIPDPATRLQGKSETGGAGLGIAPSLCWLLFDEELKCDPDGKTDREDGDADGSEICDIRHKVFL